MAGLGVGPLLGGRVGGDRAVTDVHRAQLAVDRAHDRADAALVGTADRLEAEDQPLALLELDLVLGAGGGDRRGTARSASTDTSPYFCRDSANSLAGPGNSNRFRRAARVLAQAFALLGVEVGLHGLDRATLERLGAERLRPATGRVAELAGQEADNGVGHVELARLGLELGRVGPTATRCRARSPTTFEDGVTFTMLPRMSLAAAYMSSICSNFSPRPREMACCRRFESWPPGISWVYTRPVGDGRPDSNGA